MDSFTDLPAVTAQPEHHPANAAPPFSSNGAHPPYSEMITAAIVALNDKDGSSRQAIAKYIEKEYSNLPPTHPNLLTHHLKRMKNEGQLMMVKHSYMLPHPRSVPFQPPTPIMDHHFTDYSVTVTETFDNTAGFKPENSSVTPRRKPGRPPKPRHDFGFQVHDEQPPPEMQPYQPQFEHPGHDFHSQNQTQTHLGQDSYGSGQDVGGNYAEPPIFASLGLADDGVTPPPPPPPENTVVSTKRGRGRPPKSASSNRSGVSGSVGLGDVTGSGSGDVEGGRRKPGRPKLMSISMVNGGVVKRGKRGRPKRIGGPVTVPLSGNLTRSRGRPKRAVNAETGSVSRGRGRPPKNIFRNLTSQSFGRPSKVGPGTAVLVTDPHQLVAYQELKLKYENLQTKAKEVVGVVRPYINPDYEAFGALQELETLVGPEAVVQSEKPPSYV